MCAPGFKDCGWDHATGRWKVATLVTCETPLMSSLLYEQLFTYTTWEGDEKTSCADGGHETTEPCRVTCQKGYNMTTLDGAAWDATLGNGICTLDSASGKRVYKASGAGVDPPTRNVKCVSSEVECPEDRKSVV